MKSANIDSIKYEFSEYLFDKTEHPDWLPANPSKAGHKGLSIFGACYKTKHNRHKYHFGPDFALFIYIFQYLALFTYI